MQTTSLKQLLAEARVVVPEISAEEAKALVDDADVVFVDVRETAERQKTGSIRGAVHAPRGFIEIYASPESPRRMEVFGSGKRLVVFCASGMRSALAGKTLRELGIEHAYNLAGGFAAWCSAGGPIVEPPLE